MGRQGLEEEEEKKIRFLFEIPAEGKTLFCLETLPYWS